MSEKLELGIKYQDKISGMVGTLTGIVEYTNAATEGLLSRMDSAGRPIEQWFDEGRLVRVSDAF